MLIFSNKFAKTYCSEPISCLYGEVTVPGDKSISHRALLLAALADGVSRIDNILLAMDVIVTSQALIQLGVNIKEIGECQWQVDGCAGKFQTPRSELYLANSGTGARLLAGLLAGANIPCQISGDASLSQRPMQRIVKPLQQMGANIQASLAGTLPLELKIARPLKAIHYAMQQASAQVKSAILLAALQTQGRTVIEQPAPSRDHTERMLHYLGVDLLEENNSIQLSGQKVVDSCDWRIPGDFSSAAFFIIAAVLAKQARISLLDVGVNPTRIGLLTVLERMGAKIQLKNKRYYGLEPVADIDVFSSSLRGIDVPQQLIPSMIDEIPLLLLAATFAKGKTILKGAQELRYKECDRIRAMVIGLRRLGVIIEETEDGVIMVGGVIQGGEVDSFADHRIAMTFLIAGSVASAPIRVNHCEHIATSFPNFISLAGQLGLNLKKEHDS